MESAVAASSAMHPAAIGGAVLYAISFFIGLLPFGWHVKGGNVGAASLIGWCLLTNVFYFLYAVIWGHDNMATWWSGKGLCDIGIRVNVAAVVGLPASLVLILFDLSKLFSPNRVAHPPTPRQARLKKIFDYFFCIGFPVLIAALYYLIQPVRFVVYGIAGCEWTYSPSWLSWILVLLWPWLYCLVGVFYGLLILYRLTRYRTEFASLMQDSKMSRSKFVRLYMLGFLPILVVLPIQVMVLIVRFKYVYRAYSFKEVHENFSTILYKPSMNGQVPWDHYISPVSLLFSFVLFGTGADALQTYARWSRKLGLDKVFNVLFPPCFRQSVCSAAAAVSAPFSRLTNRIWPPAPEKDTACAGTATDSLGLPAGISTPEHGHDLEKGDLRSSSSQPSSPVQDHRHSNEEKKRKRGNTDSWGFPPESPTSPLPLYRRSLDVPAEQRDIVGINQVVPSLDTGSSPTRPLPAFQSGRRHSDAGQSSSSLSDFRQ